VAPKIVALDFDGTVVDSMGSLADEAVETLMAAGYPDADGVLSAYLKTSGLSFRQQVDLLIPGVSASFKDEVASSFHERTAHIYDSVGLVPGVLDFIEGLRSKRSSVVAVVIVSSSSSRVVQRACKRLLPYDGHHDVVVLGRSLSFDTKASQLVDIVRAAFGDPQRVAFIGDSPRDAHIADEAGIKNFVALTRLLSLDAYGDAPHKFDTFDEIAASAWYSGFVLTP